MFKTIKLQFLPILICLLMTGLICISALHLNINSDIAANADIANTDCIDIPIIMYHAVSDAQSIQGDYVISSAEFENDIIYFKQNNYSFVLISDIINFVKGNKDIPKKSVALTFDDGYYNNYLYAYPLIKKYNAKISLAPVAYFSELYSNNGEVSEYYSHCTWQQLKEMADSGLVELGNHSYNLHTCDGTHNGIGQLANEDTYVYKDRIRNDLTTAQNIISENTGVTCQFIAYPFGIYNKSTQELVKEMGFSAALTCTGGINHLQKGNIDSLFELKRLIRPHNCEINNIIEKWS